MKYPGKNRLWRIPQQGKLRGVCAGLAEYLDVPVRLVRVIVVLSLFLGLFMFTVLAYFILGFVLDAKPDSLNDVDHQPSAGELLHRLDAELRGEERQVQDIEKYVTSESFSVRSRFRQL